MKKFILALICLACATGCYRMPCADDYSLVPLTNNPDITREPNTSMPGMGGY